MLTGQENWQAVELFSRKPVGNYYLNFNLTRPPGFDFAPGQYLKIVREPSDTPMYVSIASSPAQKSHLDFCLIAQSQSPVTQFILNAPLKSQLKVSAAMGKFTIVDHHRPMQFIAGGSGVAPIRAFLKDFSPQVVTQKVRLVYGCRQAEAVPFHDEFLEMAKLYPQFDLHVVAEDKESSKICRGGVMDVLEVLKDLDQFDHYICGSGPMVQAVRQKLVERQADPHRIYSDK